MTLVNLFALTAIYFNIIAGSNERITSHIYAAAVKFQYFCKTGVSSSYETEELLKGGPLCGA
jgi:hypothetical protein